MRAPPGEFVLDTPSGWVHAARIPLQWEAPLAGAGKLTYAVLVDDREVAESLTATEYTLTRSQIPNGVHTIQVEATDSLGQVVDSVPATLQGRPHAAARARARARQGSSVTVRVSDGAKGQVSGVDTGSVHVSFGVGAVRRAHGRTRARPSLRRPRRLHDRRSPPPTRPATRTKVRRG